MYNLTVIAGVIVSIFYTECTCLSAGLVAPGYLALSLSSPLRILYTLALALAAMGICRLLSNRLILFGQRRFAVMILSSFLIDQLLCHAAFIPFGFDPIGVLVPGIIARCMDRQGVLKTLVSLMITTCATALVMHICLALGL